MHYAKFEINLSTKLSATNASLQAHMSRSELPGTNESDCTKYHLHIRTQESIPLIFASFYMIKSDIGKKQYYPSEHSSYGYKYPYIYFELSSAITLQADENDNPEYITALLEAIKKFSIANGSEEKIVCDIKHSHKILYTLGYRSEYSQFYRDVSAQILRPESNGFSRILYLSSATKLPVKDFQPAKDPEILVKEAEIPSLAIRVWDALMYSVPKSNYSKKFFPQQPSPSMLKLIEQGRNFIEFQLPLDNLRKKELFTITLIGTLLCLKHYLNPLLDPSDFPSLSDLAGVNIKTVGEKYFKQKMLSVEEIIDPKFFPELDAIQELKPFLKEMMHQHEEENTFALS